MSVQAPPRPAPVPRAPAALTPRFWWRLVPLAVFVVTVAARLFHIRRAYDVFLDESVYSRIAAGAAVDWRLVFGAYPFYLHGPLSFYLQSLVIRAFGISGTAVQVVYDLRTFNVLIAGLVAVMVYELVRCVSSRTWALVAAAIFAFDPFIVSFDSRLFIETLATLWVALGYRILVGLADAEVFEAGLQDRAATAARRRRALAAGVVFGLALLTKETSAALYVLPLLWCVLRGNPLRRSSALTALLAAAVTYAPYPIIAVATGGGGEFVQQKFSGVERLLGIEQETGFNRPGAPSLLSRIGADIDTFLMTYILIGLGVLAAIWVYRRGSVRQRVVALWGLGALAMLLFQVTQGTIEEQMFYYLVVPSIVLVAVALALGFPQPRFSRWRGVAIAALVVIGAFDAVTWVQAHTRNDTAIASTVAWMQTHAPAGTRVAPLADGIQFLLPDYRLLFNPEAGEVSPAQLSAAHTQLVITSSLQAEQGYSAASPALIRWLRSHSRERHASSGASAGTVVVWQLAGELPHTAPPGPERLQPRAPISIGARTYHG